jgi:prephenate dehydrogenase
MAWAAEYLPENVHFVGGNPIIGARLEKGDMLVGREDLFRGGLFCLVPSPGADADAVKLATDLVRVLGANPLFYDAVEHDGLMAAVEHLPSLMALALLDMVVSQPTWRELRKVAGPTFELMSYLPSSDVAAMSDLYASNRENVLRWMDAFSASLASIGQIVAESEPEELTARLQDAVVEREKWLADRAAGHWREGAQTELPPRPNMLDSLFGSFWRRGPKKDT